MCCCYTSLRLTMNGARQVKEVVLDTAAGQVNDEDEEGTKGKEREEEIKDGSEEKRKRKAIKDQLRVAAIKALGNALPPSSGGELSQQQRERFEEHCRFLVAHLLATEAIFQVPLLHALSRCVKVTQGEVEREAGHTRFSPPLVRDILRACWPITDHTKVE